MSLCWKIRPLCWWFLPAFQSDSPAVQERKANQEKIQHTRQYRLCQLFGHHHPADVFPISRQCILSFDIPWDRSRLCQQLPVADLSGL